MPDNSAEHYGKDPGAIRTGRLTFLTRDIVPKEQFGGREGYAAPDAVFTPPGSHSARGEGAFDQVNRDTLISIPVSFDKPSAAICGVYHFYPAGKRRCSSTAKSRPALQYGYSARITNLATVYSDQKEWRPSNRIH
jgi:hypothetical protein